MILLSLLGEQTIPNLIPLWQTGDFTATIFAATSTTKGQVEILSRAIKNDPQLKNIEILPPLYLDAYVVNQARACLGNALNQFREANLPVCLNFTCGTKIMSMAALQAAFGSGVKLLYVSTENNELIYFQSDGSEIDREPIDVHISAFQYFAAHGIEASLNQNFNSVSFSDLRPPREGDYLEEAIYRQVKDSGWFDDVQKNVFIRKKTKRGEVGNELDVVATNNGRLVVCSCKAGEIDKEDLYELSSLSRRESAGIYCGKVLASTLDEFPSALRERALANGIHLVYGKEIQNAAGHFRTALR